MDRATNRPRGFAFAQFGSDALAADAVRRFDGADLRGRRMRVNDADDKPPPRAPRADGPGGGGGGGGGYAPRPPGGGGYAPRPAGVMPRSPMEFAPPPEDGGGDFKGFRKGGGSRRGLRARKRSLRY